ncbi:MAG: methylmalonyl Co-A mutase-associated GTPase MeaB [Magnetococcales bacterium]|nr:methylmalonyl Co-A mutase-associated GTPase MeaB [Magnetococcales bacterium]
MTTTTTVGTPEWLESIQRGDRRALAKAITLIESNRPQDSAVVRALWPLLLPYRGTALRVAISGPPGVGKSSLIEQIGLQAVARKMRTAVLAVDPSSPVSGGSILGDKTRMPHLSSHAMAFVRPTPAGSTLGGVARSTRETMLLLDAALFDLLLVETVGVGQSETEVAGMVDLFVLVLQPHSGDELQGIKRGIMEMADIILINKADGDMVQAAEMTCHQVHSALSLRAQPAADWQPCTRMVSAVSGQGMAAALDLFTSFRDTLSASGALQRKRLTQASNWMWQRLREGLMARFMSDPTIQRLLSELEPLVCAGSLDSVEAADRLLAAFYPKGK